LELALHRLHSEDRELLELKYFSQLTVRTLAEKFSVSPKAIESRRTRARAGLRKELIAILRNS
jgi:RNA polymerase sigma factor (sigma-70 family)